MEKPTKKVTKSRPGPIPARNKAITDSSATKPNTIIGIESPEVPTAVTLMEFERPEVPEAETFYEIREAGVC